MSKLASKVAFLAIFEKYQILALEAVSAAMVTFTDFEYENISF